MTQLTANCPKKASIDYLDRRLIVNLINLKVKSPINYNNKVLCQFGSACSDQVAQLDWWRSLKNVLKSISIMTRQQRSSKRKNESALLDPDPPQIPPLQKR